MKNNFTPKERILETAYRLFYKQGYNATGINQILDEAKVAKASLYQHYGSKEELGVAYIKKVREEWFLAFETHLAKTEGPKNKILAIFDFLLINMTRNDYRGCHFLNLLTDIDTTDSQMNIQILAHKTKLRNVFKTLVQQYTQDDVELPLPNTADIIYLLFEGAIVEAKVCKDAWPILTAKKSADNILKLAK